MDSQPQHKLSYGFWPLTWARHGMLQERTIPTCRTPARAVAQRIDGANRIAKNNFCSFWQSYREESCLPFALCFPPWCTPRPATQAQSGQLEPPGQGGSLQEDCDFGPARSSQPYLSLLSEFLPNVSMVWKSHRAPISILKLMVDLWSWYSQFLRLWRCCSWCVDTEAAVQKCFQFGFGVGLPHKHTHRPFSALKPPPAPRYHPARLQTMEERKRFLAPSCQAGRQQHEGWGKQWDIKSTNKRLNFRIACPFYSYLALLLVDITFSEQQEHILPFSHSSNSSFLHPALVSILDLVEKKRLI